MKLLGVSLTLCILLTLSRALPLTVNTTISRHMGFCEYVLEHSPTNFEEFVPQCDADGNFLPQQCWGSTGYCWCVHVITGEEIPNTRMPPGVAPVNCEKEFLCPNGWSHFGKRCFTIVYNWKTWVEAEGYCLFEGANLASVHSYEENHFIQGLIREYTHDLSETWIGGHNALHSLFWMWSDGSMFNYDNWYKDCKMERTDHCLKMNYGYEKKWNYSPCNETRPFVCAKRI